MRKYIPWIALSLLCLGAAAAPRPPYAAGLFYPSNPVELGGMIDDYLSIAPVPETLGEKNAAVTAIIVPHAGYVFAGRTAARAYRRVQGRSYETVVLIGPYHKKYFTGASIWTAGNWSTPLGEVFIDTETAEAIRSENPAFAYDPAIHKDEQSLENQLPFLQRALEPGFKIVPILVDDPSPENTEALAAAIQKHLAGRNALIVVSTDMTHYRPADEAEARDQRSLDLIAKKSVLSLSMALKNGDTELCGQAAVLTYLNYALSIGKPGSKITALGYSTSAGMSGQKNSVVGYGALVDFVAAEEPAPAAAAPASQITGPPLEAAPETGVYTEAQKKELLGLARRAVEDAVNGFDEKPAVNYDPAFDVPKAVFVTLRRKEALRGCIGRFTPEDPLYLAVQKTARHAATKDNRYKPVKPDELSDLEIEISILNTPKKVSTPDDIRYGRDGVILTAASRKGVFLPSMAKDMGWTRDQFLEALCREKMGLPADCWQDPATEIETFSTEEIRE